MRQVISKYPLLNTVETLTAAGTLIAKVKGQQMGRGSKGRLPGRLPGGGALKWVLKDAQEFDRHSCS